LNFHEEPRGYYVVYNSEVQNPMLVKQKNVRAACGVQIYRIDKITGEKIFENEERNCSGFGSGYQILRCSASFSNKRKSSMIDKEMQ